jgi:hypothetical protein
VRETRDGGRESVVMGSRGSAALDGFADPANGAPASPNAALLAPPTRSTTVGRRRGHLRVLPDPPQ